MVMEAGKSGICRANWELRQDLMPCSGQNCFLLQETSVFIKASTNGMKPPVSSKVMVTST